MLPALRVIVTREMLRFVRQRGRLVAALVRPLIWLLVFAAGFRAALGLSIIPPYETYITYEVYIVPGLCGMIQLFNGMQSSLSLVYDREMGSMRLLLTSPMPRWWLLLSKLIAGGGGLDRAGLRVSRHRGAFRDRDAVAGLSDRAAGAGSVGDDAGRARAGAVLDDPAAGELRGRDELRDLSCLFPVLRALSALEDGGEFDRCCSGSAPRIRSPMRSR